MYTSQFCGLMVNSTVAQWSQQIKKEERKEALIQNLMPGTVFQPAACLQKARRMVSHDPMSAVWKLRNPSCEVHCLNWLCQEAKEAGRLARRARTKKGGWQKWTHGATEVTEVIEVIELTEVTEVTTSNPKASLETRHNFSLWHLVAAVVGQ